MVLMAGCVSLPQRAPELAGCEAAFATSDARLRAAGVVDTQSRGIEGFAYLRVNRFLESFASQVHTPAAVAAWVAGLHRLALEGRSIELAMLYRDSARADAVLQRLAVCGQRLMAADLLNPRRVAALRRRAQVPDSYNDAARAAGLYPLAAAGLALGIHQWQAQVQSVYARPLQGLERRGRLRVYAPRPPVAAKPQKIAAWLAQARARSPLGIPALPPEQMRHVARYFAPYWVIDTAGYYDLPGAPTRRDGGLTVDASPPPVYFLATYTRFHGRVLLQLVYLIWFSQRPPDGWWDPLAGRLDGLIWRVTLGADGEPLLYDSIHPCGCYHLFFPSPELTRRPRGGLWSPAVTVPQRPPATDRVALRVASASHYLQRVSAAADAPPVDRFYRLRPYAALRREPQLFSADGLIHGSERAERWYLWVSGVPSPGAMRQWGHHATAFVGKRHFDAPFLIDRIFERKP